MKTSFILTGILSTTLILAACGKNESSSQKFSYNLSYNGCETGEHSFNTKEEYCKALLDDERNNNCAFQLRDELYERECQ